MPAMAIRLKIRAVFVMFGTCQRFQDDLLRFMTSSRVRSGEAGLRVDNARAPIAGAVPPTPTIARNRSRNRHRAAADVGVPAESAARAPYVAASAGRPSDWYSAARSARTEGSQPPCGS